MTKICPHCKIAQPIENFGKNRHRKSGLTDQCKKCSNLYSKKFIESNPEYKKQQDIKNAERYKIYRINNKDRKRNRILFRTYGITLEQYNQMYTQQNGVCAICGQPEKVIRQGQVANLAVDHDHKTGKVRALLCNSCNLIIGYAHEDFDLLRKMSDYIIKWR